MIESLRPLLLFTTRDTSLVNCVRYMLLGVEFMRLNRQNLFVESVV
jgi:hypothetical protein